MKKLFSVALTTLFLLKSVWADEGKPTDQDTALRLQIFLDQQCFGPGFLDGKPGKFTSNAVYAYNRVKGRSPGDWASVVSEAKAEVETLYAMATVPSFAKKYVNPKLPKKREGQARVKQMSYRSYLEFMAERYHTSESFLIEINSRKKAYGLRPRSLLKVPNIEPFQVENLAKGRSHKKENLLSSRTVVIDTANKAIYVYDKNTTKAATSGALVVVEDGEEDLGEVVAMFPVTPGKERFIHRGEWKIVNSVELPEWRYDKQLLEKGIRGKKALKIPPGPNNPVGVLWNGLSKSGIGIHGTSSPRTIGRSRSAGCYRLANWDVVRFPLYARPGARVIVR